MSAFLAAAILTVLIFPVGIRSILAVFCLIFLAVVIGIMQAGQ